MQIAATTKRVAKRRASRLNLYAKRHSRKGHGRNAGLSSERTQPRLFGERHGGDVDADRLADRDRDLARRRQRGRCGGCGLRGARRRRAAIDRDRRRLLLPLRAGRRRQGRRRQWLRPVGGRGFARRDRGEGSRPARQCLAAHGHHSRRRFRLAVAARHLRDQGLRRIAEARDPLCRGRLPGAPAGGVGLVVAGRQAQARRKPAFPARRPRAPRRRPFRPDGAWRYLARHRQGRRGRLL